MRIVIDMQGAQTESRFRGIGRYTLAFAQAVVRSRGDHEVLLALNGLFPDTIEPIRAAFDGLLPRENIRVWHAPGPVKEQGDSNTNRREAAELLREAFLASLQPDIVHIPSLFEGYGDDAVTSVRRFDRRTLVSVTVHDLIPLLSPEHYLAPNPEYDKYYRRKLDCLRKADLFLSVSDSSRSELIENLGIDGSIVLNASEGVDACFRRIESDDNCLDLIREKFDLHRPFVLYTGGADERKNLPRLIKAWSALKPALREKYQLVFAGRMPKGMVERFSHIVTNSGLQADELRFSGYVSDQELVQLYNLCALFVFPSWHEGFGLPALEAMACGAPVIGANTSSLPEVIGLDEALFDPFDVGAITQKIAQVLEDQALNTRLREHGLSQAKKFSWDETARKAIAAWERMSAAPPKTYLQASQADERLFSQLAPQAAELAQADQVQLAACLAANQQAGIERQLLLDVSELCQRDAATGVQRVVRSYLKGLLESPPPGFRVEPVYGTRDQGYRYARRYTLRFLGLTEETASDAPVRWQRGDVFFGLDMQHHVQLAHAAFYRQLRSEGVVVKFLVYDLLPIEFADLFADQGAKALHEQWLAMIASTDGAVCISKATADAFERWIVTQAVARAPSFSVTWVHMGGDIECSKPSQGLPDDAQPTLECLSQRPSFLCVSTLEPRKCQQQILDAIEQLWRDGHDVNLVFVGQQGWNVDALVKRLRKHPESGRRLFWLAGISDEYLDRVYQASTCLVAASLNEGFGLSLIEAARHDIPIVARDIPVFREIAGDHVHYFRGENGRALADALAIWLREYRAGLHPLSTGLSWSTWQQSTEKLKSALVEVNYTKRQLLVDISELVQRDAKTGIQRVVRSILLEWLNHPPAGYRVEPVYATFDGPYRYARQFVRNFLALNEDYPAGDEPIEYAAGDVFFGLDLQPQLVPAHRMTYRAMRASGVYVGYLLYDLLCVQMPEFFPHGAAATFERWLDIVIESDGAVCISRTVAEDLAAWIKAKHPRREGKFKISWFYNGADMKNSKPSMGLPADAEKKLELLRSRQSFLMVGTLEPRKGHAQTLDAFELLWTSGNDINLVIVGKVGWMVDSLVRRLREHPENGKRLHWFTAVSDQYLEQIYGAACCLVAASYGEGFGLPLIEAAQHQLPIIARDIPVFREVAGEHAEYFRGEDGRALADALEDWLAKYHVGQHRSSAGMRWLTWKQSADNLTIALLGTSSLCR